MGETLAQTAASWTFGVFVLLVGLCIGSFLNVCIHRLPAGKSLLRPSSHCTSCQAPIAWYDNIPVVSYFVLGGQCRRCGARFSIRYMLVEAATGLVFFGYWVAFFRFGVRGGPGGMEGTERLGVYAVYMALIGALVVSGVIDLERKEIYTSVTYFAAGVGVVGSFIWPAVQRIGAYDHQLSDITGWPRTNAVALAVMGAVVGAGIVYLARVLFTQAFKKEAMGMGDAYLMAAVGAVLGWEGALLVFFVAPFLALPYGLWQLVRHGGEDEGGGAGEPEAPRRTPVPWPSLATTVAGFVLLVAAALAARTGWTLGPRLALVGSLAAFATGFWRASREEDRQAEAHEEPARAPASHEVPYGPFLGLATAIVMLVQDVVIRWLGFGRLGA
jgi:leader peptidase (prepilin peptidase)/N-methyltransferase